MEQLAETIAWPTQYERVHRLYGRAAPRVEGAVLARRVDGGDVELGHFHAAVDSGALTEPERAYAQGRVAEQYERRVAVPCDHGGDLP